MLFYRDESSPLKSLGSEVCPKVRYDISLISHENIKPRRSILALQSVEKLPH
jgi:hypothetical protein